MSDTAIYSVDRTFGPVASGTLVRVTAGTVVELLAEPSKDFQKNLQAHGMDWRNLNIPLENLTRRRYNIR